ncbi:MAG: HD domain-containing protein [Telmatospirillum sp.]|nr:HD domain-containing protein [Telmatospirillum sp.]
MKHIVAVVDGNSQHRDEVAQALLSFYTVHPYADQSSALAGMLVSAPKLILVGQHVGTGSGATFIRDLRREAGLSRIPVLFVVDNEDMRTWDTIRDLGIRDHLVKPYRRSALINAISRQVNGSVEKSWIQLPPVQRKALEGTLSVFNSIADQMAGGAPLSFAAIADPCSAIVDAVHNDDFAPLLERIRDHDNFTYVHSLRFATLLSMFGRAIGLSRDQQVLVASGGLIHDIGKMAISRELLNKQGRLSAEEMILLRSHVSVAEKILSASESIPKGVATIVLHHHERLDGSGYPRGLKGRELNQLARMAGIIDVFCALTDRRPYRRTMKAYLALDIMATDMKEALDQDLLGKFRDLLIESMGPEETAAPEFGSSAIAGAAAS